MTTDRETLQRMAAWLEDGRTQLPDHVLDAVLEQLPSKRQRRPRWPARRVTDMNPIAKFAIAAAAVVVVAIVGFNLLRPAAPSQVGGMASPSPEPSSSPAPLAPTTGAIEPGRYRWTSPGGEVSFALPDGWTGQPEGLITKNIDTAADITLGHNLPGSRYEVTHVYADACLSENALEPIGDTVADLVGALDAQASTDVVVRDVAAGSVVGQRVEVNEAPGVDRSTCRYGAEAGAGAPLQIWADEAETDYFAFAPGFRGVVYAFDVDGERFAFNATIGPEATEADVAAVDAVVESFEFPTP